MKTSGIFAAVGLLVIVAFGSCKKNYTCTCTTIVGTASSVNTHSIDNASYPAAKRTCNDYESEANHTLPGTTSCHL